MADTGAPHFIPYVEPTDLVRDYPAADEAQAEAVADALDAAGGLVAVKSAIFTGVQSGSLAVGANYAVTDLTITHEVADPANRLIISVFLGASADHSGLGATGVAVDDGSGLIAVGNANGSRTQVTAGGRTSNGVGGSTPLISTLAATFVHTPGAGSKTYTARVINLASGTITVSVNRSQPDANNGQNPRAVSSLVISEVKV